MTDSQDWEHEHKSTEETRRYGWLDVIVGSYSSITYTQSQFATERGYDAMLVMHLDTVAISSSVNYLTFLEAKSCKLSMSMPTPLSWNARRDWSLDLTLDTPEVSLLRDHVQVISDLAKDWSSGQVGDFHHFVPNHYNFRIVMLNYGFHLCLNDFNIIDAPLSREQNAFMDIKGPRMEAYVAVGNTQYRAELSTIPFTVDLKDAVVEMSIPSWDTHRSFSESSAFEVGKIGDVSAKGSYTFYSTPKPDHQETLVLHLEGRGVVFKALGWVLRRMFCTKDNYFGGFTQFATTMEFVERFDHDPDSVGDPIEEKYRPGRSDAFAVNVTMNVEESLILLSDQIYGSEKGLAMPVPQLQMSLKSVEHFMELSLDAMPTYIVEVEDLERAYQLGVAPPIKTKESIFVEGIELRANRLFGPQPRATTYLCLWEFVSPRITAFLSPQLLSTIKAAVSAVAYNFTDVENAPADFYMPKTPPDVTFFKLGIDHVAATLFCDDGAAVSIDLASGVNLDTSSLATQSFKSAVGLIVPAISVTLLDHDSFQRKWDPVGTIATNLALDVFNAPAGWQRKASDQQQFLIQEDKPTKRISYMYRDVDEPSDGQYVHTAYLPRPQPDQAWRGEDDASFASANSDDGAFSDRETSDGSSPSDEGGPTTSRALHRRRSRSFATAKETLRSAVGDESDSVSEASASTASIQSTNSRRKDMASALVERVRMFRCARGKPLPRFSEWKNDPATELPKASSRTELKDGTIIRVSMDKLDIEISTRTILNASKLHNAIQSVTPSPEVQLDELVVYHSDTVLEDVAHKDPTLIDLSVPMIRVLIDTPIREDRVDLTEAVIRGITASILMTPEQPETPKALDVTTAIRLLSLTASTRHMTKGHISLADIDDSDTRAGSAYPVLGASMEDFEFGLHQSIEQHYRGRAASVNVRAVNMAAKALIETSKVWDANIDLIKSVTPRKASAGALLYRIIESATAAGVTSTSPAFYFESGYELHAPDQRNIRRDAGWLMLSRLRHWLRRSDLSAAAGTNVPADEMSLRVVMEMARLEDAFCGDESLVLLQPFIKKTLSSTAALPQSPGIAMPPKVAAIFVNLGTFTLRHHGRLLESSAIASSTFALSSATAGVQQSRFTEDAQEIEHIRCVLTVKGISSELHDSMLPAIETLLTLAPRAIDKVPVLEVENIVQPETLLTVDVHLQTAEMSVLAGGLRLRLALRDLEQALARRSGYREHDQKNRKISHDSVFLCCKTVELALLQPKEDHDLAANLPDRIVTCLDITGVRINVDNRSLGVKEKPTITRILFGVKSVDFDSRPQLRAFLAFARDWQKQHLK